MRRSRCTQPSTTEAPRHSESFFPGHCTAANRQFWTPFPLANTPKSSTRLPRNPAKLLLPLLLLVGAESAAPRGANPAADEGGAGPNPPLDGGATAWAGDTRHPARRTLFRGVLFLRGRGVSVPILRFALGSSVSYCCTHQPRSANVAGNGSHASRNQVWQEPGVLLVEICLASLPDVTKQVTLRFSCVCARSSTRRHPRIDQSRRSHTQVYPAGG